MKPGEGKSLVICVIAIFEGLKNIQIKKKSYINYLIIQIFKVSFSEKGVVKVSF